VLVLLAADAVGVSPRNPALAADAVSDALRLGNWASYHPYTAAEKVIRLAERGDLNAQAQLGWMYSIGRGVPQNYLLAAKWFRIAANRGHGGAQFALGLLYNKGQGVPLDVVLAYMWMNLSASQAVGDDRDFKVRLRDGLASKMTIAQVEAAQQMARAWADSQ
jgi:TPR repeat protein